MYEKELQRILTASQNNALTFFVGAGVSALSGAPTWKGLIHAISDRFGQARKDEYRFDVSWLLNLYPHTLEQIAKNEKVKGCVRVAIADALNDGEIALSDSQRLQSILIKHFC